MGKINDIKDFFSGKDKKKEKAEEKAGKINSKIKLVTTKAIIVGTIKFISSISVIIIIAAGVMSLINKALDYITSKNTPARIYEAFELENEDFTGLVEIKGDESNRLLSAI